MHAYTLISRTSLLVVLAIGTGACSDPVAPTRPDIAVALIDSAQSVPVGGAVLVLPSVRVATSAGRPVPGVRVSFAVLSGGGTITGTEQVTDANGVARLGSWTLGAEPGRNSVGATVDGLPDLHLIFEAMGLPEDCTGLVLLDLPIGAFVRVKDSETAPYPCLYFDSQQSAGNEYILLFENMSPTGSASEALFTGPRSAASLAFTLDLAPLAPAAAPPAALRMQLPPANAAQRADESYTWDFGAGRIREHVPEPRDFIARPMLLRGGRTVELNSVSDPVPGDTIQVLMEVIPRLGITERNQRAVIRFVSDDLIIAEDIRLATTLTRPDGNFNRPIPEADLLQIAEEYSANARPQGDIFFEGRYNSAVEATSPHRVTAIHSLMPAEDVWGYTYSASDYFVWDYWVGTDGATKGLNQHPQRVTDNLFMHEIAHMRHFGLLQRHQLETGPRGNVWLLEGFARFMERMPIAARLLDEDAPSRTGNVELPRNPDFNNAYFMDDVPTYLHASSSMFFGYHTSAFVFDYFADQVTLQGGDWMVATREFILAGQSRMSLDAVTDRWLPGTSFADLFTQARIALYTDDIGTAGLPVWTQYHQFKLRESRPAPQQAAAQDPRVQWVRISTAAPISISGEVAAGAAAGFIVDGTSAPTGLIRVTAPQGPHALLSIARIR